MHSFCAQIYLAEQPISDVFSNLKVKEPPSRADGVRRCDDSY